MCVALGWRFATEIERCVWQDWQTDESSNTVIVTVGSSSDMDSLDDVTDDTEPTDSIGWTFGDGLGWSE